MDGEYQPKPYLIKYFLPCIDNPTHTIFIYYLDTPMYHIHLMHSLHKIHSINFKQNYIAVFVETALKY